MPSGCLSTKDRIVGWGDLLGCCRRRENNRDDVVSGVSPVVQAWRLHFRTFVLWEHATDATNSGVLRALLLSPALFFDSAWNFTIILQLRSNRTHSHYQLIKAGSNQKERRYYIRFVTCDPIRTAAVAVPGSRVAMGGSFSRRTWLFTQPKKTVRNQQPSWSVDQ